MATFLRTRCKWPLLVILGVEDKEGVEVSEVVEVKEEDFVEEGGMEETVEIGIRIKVDRDKVKVKDKVQVKGKGLTLAIRLSAIKIHLHSSHVIAIGPLARVLIFVWSQQLVLGRSSGFQSLINEILTSSTIEKISS